MTTESVSSGEVAGPSPDASRERPAHAVDRRHRILERVAAEQTIHVAELARELAVSEMTIRRDIRRLERDGFVRQTHGGATAHLTRSLELAFSARALQHAREKRLIGMAAQALIPRSGLVYVGIGTTAEQFARYLPSGSGLTVVTASLPIASLLGSRSIRAVSTGGTVLHDELTCGGPIATGALARYRFDVAVIGAAGISARWGITELNEEEAEVQRTALDRADRVIVLADGSKVGEATAVVVVPAERIATLVTDAGADAERLAELQALGIEVIRVDGDARGERPRPGGSRSSAA